jgi:23S rRNA (uracil1939-C5)-methyltransferase
LELAIEKLVYGGDGLGRLPPDERGRRRAVFVPFVIEHESVDTELRRSAKGFMRGGLTRVLTPSPYRIEPGCPYFQSCGGCHYQHISYEHQLEVKAAILKENLQRQAKLEVPVELQIHSAEPWGYRNRTRLKVQTAPEFAIGYFRFNSHELLPVRQCPISSPLINRAIAAMWKLGQAGLAKSIAEIEFFVNAHDSQMLVELYGQDSPRGLAENLRAAVPEVSGVIAFASGRDQLEENRPGRAGNSERENTRFFARQKPAVLLGSAELVYATRFTSYRVSAGAFFQVNRHLTETLVSIVTGGRSGEVALDLYAGGGLFSTVLSREFEKVVAVEWSPISHADLKYNSPRNVKAIRATSAEYLQQAAGKLKPDLVVMDPPRAGLGESVVHRLVSLGAPRMIYVSCDPATLSRDLGTLLKAGYSIEQAHLVDLFPQTYHLESVFHLVR